MPRNDEPFIPDSLDEQLDILSRFTADQQSASTNTRLMRDLQEIYASETPAAVTETEEELILTTVWNRLAEHMEQTEQGQQPMREEALPDLQPLVAARKRRPLHGTYTREHAIMHHITTIAAVVTVTFLVGSIVWVLTMARERGGNPTTSSAASSGVYVGTDGGIYRSDRQTGRVLWSYLIPGTSMSGGYIPISAMKLVVINETVYAAVTVGSPTKSYVVALDAATGQVRWKHSFSEGSLLSDMTMASGLLYASVMPPNGQPGPGVTYALQLSDGSASDSYPIAGNITVVNRVLYATGNGISAVSLTTGRVLWHTPMNGVHMLAPHVVNGKLYVSSWSSTDLHSSDFVSAYDTHTGKRLWQSPQWSGTGTGSFSVITDVTIVNAVLYVGFQNQVFAYQTQTDHLLWSQKVDGLVQQTPLVAEGRVYVAVSAFGPSQEECAVMALQVQSGHVLWTSLVGGGNVLTGPVVAQGMVYAANVTTYALRGSNGASVWQSSINNPYLSNPLVMVAIA